MNKLPFNCLFLQAHTILKNFLGIYGDIRYQIYDTDQLWTFEDEIKQQIQLHQRLEKVATNSSIHSQNSYLEVKYQSGKQLFHYW